MEAGALHGQREMMWVVVLKQEVGHGTDYFGNNSRMVLSGDGSRFFVAASNRACLVEKLSIGFLQVLQ